MKPLQRIPAWVPALALCLLLPACASHWECYDESMDRYYSCRNDGASYYSIGPEYEYSIYHPQRHGHRHRGAGHTRNQPRHKTSPASRWEVPRASGRESGIKSPTPLSRERASPDLSSRPSSRTGSRESNASTGVSHQSTRSSSSESRSTSGSASSSSSSRRGESRSSSSGHASSRTESGHSSSRGSSSDRTSSRSESSHSSSRGSGSDSSRGSGGFGGGSFSRMR